MTIIDTIQQNPFVSLAILLAPCIGIAWKVFEALFVKPRDFRIETLEKNVDDLRKQLQSTSDSPTPIQSKVLLTNETSAPPVVASISVENTEDLTPSSDLLNNPVKFYMTWKNKNFTRLQRDHFEKSYIGQKVVWKVKLGDVSEESSGFLWASLFTLNGDGLNDHVIAVFEQKHKSALFMLKPDTAITVTGIIKQFSVSPLIEHCSILSVD